MKLPEWLKITLYAISAGYAALCHYFNLDPITFGVILLAMLFDWITGTARALMGRGEHKYSSQRGNNGIIVKALGAGSVLLVSLCLKVLNVPHYEYFTTAALAILAVNDVLSSLSNIYTIRTGEKLQEFDAISILIKSMHDILKKVVDKAVSRLKNTGDL